MAGCGSAPWGLWKSASCSFWLDRMLPGGLLKSHSHSAIRLRTASSSTPTMEHFLTEGSVHLALVWHSLQRKASSVLLPRPSTPQTCRPRAGRWHMPAEPQVSQRLAHLQGNGSCASTRWGLGGLNRTVDRKQGRVMSPAPQNVWSPTVVCQE